MAIIQPKLPVGRLLVEARNKLAMSQAAFGPALGASHRTATRWDAGQARPVEHELRKLAQLLVPVDLSLATEAAAHCGETLESLGLVAPEPPPEPVRPTTSPRDLVDVVVCAVAEAADVSPRTMRPLLHVAFRRAREVGLTVEQVEQALGPIERAGRPERVKQKDQKLRKSLPKKPS